MPGRPLRPAGRPGHHPDTGRCVPLDDRRGQGVPLPVPVAQGVISADGIVESYQAGRTVARGHHRTGGPGLLTPGVRRSPTGILR
jgi:hypothetical protein